MERYEINKFLSAFDKKIKDYEYALNIQELKDKSLKLEEKMNEDDFWLNRKEAQNIINENNKIKEKIDIFSDIKRNYEDIIALLEIYDEELDDSIYVDLEEEVLKLNKKIIDSSIIFLLNEPYDNLNAIMELHPGAGGTESMDWALMLFRMYQRYALKNNFQFQILDYQPGEEAGIKSCTVLIKGNNAYGYLKSERGVHRLVRISPFDSNSRRHTSFCSVDVMPEINENYDININEEDLKIDVYRSSGAGGQSVNTTDSAVRITHKPTGIIVTCQNERSQIKNREVALNILKSKLLEEEIKKQEEELKNIKGEQKDIAWGSQIRSYVFCPYTLVKDHRTNYEVSNVLDVMDGNIEEFINEYLKTK